MMTQLISDYCMWIFVLVMVMAGFFGGLINYFLTMRSDPENTSILKSVTVGIGASFLVPLFLNMISSNLIDSIKGTNNAPGDASKILVFAGFCLVASISSTAFIRTLSDRVLTEAKAARKEAEEAKLEASQAKDEVLEVQATIDPLIEKETVLEPDADKNLDMGPKIRPSEDERKILEALARSKYTYRSRSGLSRDSGIDTKKVEGLLENLAAHGLVGRREGKNAPRWFITQEGVNWSVIPEVGHSQ